MLQYLLYIYTIFITEVNGEKRAKHCDIEYIDVARNNNKIYCTKSLEGNDFVASKVQCDEEQFLNFNSSYRYTELLFKNCSLEHRIFTTIPISNIIRFVSKEENKVLKNNTFEGICSVLEINLSGNNITVIELDAFNCIHQLGILDLSNNLIESISENVFKNLERLQSLDLSRNRIQTLFRESFAGIGAIEKLILRGNNLRNVSSLPFRNSKVIKFLDLSENSGLMLVDNLLRFQTGLETLFLDHCDISSIPEGSIPNDYELRYLYLHHNKLQVLRYKYFKALQKLHFLTVSSNEISVIENGTFNDAPNLNFLFMSKNKITTLGKASLDGLFSLNYLDISLNSIRKIVSFQHLKRLKNLNISHNFLSSLPDSNTFQFNSELVELDISFNYLTEVQSIRWQKLKYLKKLMITDNKITHLFIPEIQHQLEMHLERNEIKNIYVSTKNVLNKSDRKLVLYLRENPILCDCSMYELFLIMNGNSSLSCVDFADGLTCHFPVKHKGKQFNSLNASDFQCTSCPLGCDCDFEVYDFTQNKIYCNNQNYTTIPIITSPNATLLQINQNNLTTLAGIKEKCWENLIELQAEGNKITSEEFHVPEKLKFLSLKDNRMTVLPQSIKNHAEKNLDFRMKLSNNLWPCNCSVVPFKDFLSAHQMQITDANTIRCIFPNGSMNTEALISINNSDICPLYVYYLTIYGYLMGAVFLIISLISTFYYKKKVHVLSFMYTHCNSLYMIFCCDKPNNEERMFDCFISYSSSDTDVTFAIVEELENKPPYYNFCVHERNWTPGQYITKNIIISVQNSRKTLIILSKDFVKSQWFHMEFQVAYKQTLLDKKNRLIFVLKGELPPESELESDVKHVLATVTYLQWGERWFWEKLRYALHEHKPFTGWNRDFGFRRLCKCLFPNKDTEEPECELSITQDFNSK